MQKIVNGILLVLAFSISVLLMVRTGWPQFAGAEREASGLKSDESIPVVVPSVLQEAAVLSDSSLNLPLRPKPLNPSEVHRLGSWLRERGYLYEILDSGASSIPAASGYEAMADDALRRVASTGDRTAAFLLGKRLLERPETGQPWPSKAHMEEATHWLMEASLMGYTASLELLVELARKQAMMSRWQRRDRRTSVDLLSKAYTYAYLLERRGDFSNGIELEILRQVEQLTPEQDMAARQQADAIYSEWSQKRRDMGYPPFENAVPEDIVDLHARAVALYEAK